MLYAVIVIVANPETSPTAPSALYGVDAFVPKPPSPTIQDLVKQD